MQRVDHKWLVSDSCSPCRPHNNEPPMYRFIYISSQNDANFGFVLGDGEWQRVITEAEEESVSAAPFLRMLPQLQR